MKTVAILGITGSIGSSALRGLGQYKDQIKIVAASAHENVAKALALAIEWNIENLCITGSKKCLPPQRIKVYYDLQEMLNTVKADIVLNGISSSAGLSASIQVLDTGSKLALANKETVVLGGDTFINYVKKINGTVIPVDSEHSALDELINDIGKENVSKLVITASGGPFLHWSSDDMKNVSYDMAVHHPTWNMGPKISIDSSTLANKGLEVIEAHYLFGFNPSQIEVVIHPQSIIHSMVRTVSGQVYSQMSNPDMVFPIMRALTEGKFNKPVSTELDFSDLNLTFEKPDYNNFPFLKDAFECIQKKGIYPIVYNIADEVAVEAFSQRRITFPQIYQIVHKALQQNWNYSISDVRQIPQIVAEIRRKIEVWASLL